MANSILLRTIEGAHRCSTAILKHIYRACSIREEAADEKVARELAQNILEGVFKRSVATMVLANYAAQHEACAVATKELHPIYEDNTWLKQTVGNLSAFCKTSAVLDYTQRSSGPGCAWVGVALRYRRSFSSSSDDEVKFKDDV